MYKPRGIKETAAQWVQVKSFTNVSAAARYKQGRRKGGGKLGRF